MNSMQRRPTWIPLIPWNVACRRAIPLIRTRGRALFQKTSVSTPSGFVRRFSTSNVFRHKHLEPPKPGEELTVTFASPEGDRRTLKVQKGDSLLDIAHEHDIDLEGACEGSLACSTCHVIVEPEFYEKMEEPTDEENDMLDLAPGLTETSRLGCQVIMCKDFDGMTVTLPNATRNVQQERFTERHRSERSSQAAVQ